MLFQQAEHQLHKEAIISGGKSFSYLELLDASKAFAAVLLNGEKNLNEARVNFMVEPGFDYVKTQWAIWQAGGVAVPLCLSHPLPSLQYVIEDTSASIIVVSPAYENQLYELALEKKIRFLVLGKGNTVPGGVLPEIDLEQRAMILYTSGTTDKPKGVVSTHIQLKEQINTLLSAWKWSSDDHTLCVLPLHHVHGIVNVVGCSLWCGAVCEFVPEFSERLIFDLFTQDKINVFMAVPTVYYKLIAYWEALPQDEQERLTVSMKKFRLMVCGSAALPVTVMEKWERISGHRLLERYGMTEIGMAISNPYKGERRAGYVGLPLPGVGIRLVNEQMQDVNAGEPGEILVKGKNVFNEYWNKPEATAKEFTTDGWFKTGDVAVVENGYYRILGRNSVDIIKSGGYKISAIEIEEELRKHEQIKDCAVVGIPDEEWGELIVAAIVSREGFNRTEELKDWLKERLAPYKIPRRYVMIDELPKNAMGKVVKNEVKKLFEGSAVARQV